MAFKTLLITERRFALHLILILFLGNLSTVYAQTNSAEYLEKLAKQKQKSGRIYYSAEKQSNIKVNLLSIPSGILPITWEYRFSPNFALELTPGLILPYAPGEFIKNNDKKEALILINYNGAFENDAFGPSFYIQPKYFKNLMSSKFYAVFGGFQKFKNLTVLEVGVGSGRQYTLGNFLLEPSLNVSYVKQNLSNSGAMPKYSSIFNEIREDNTSNNFAKLSLKIEIGYGL